MKTRKNKYGGRCCFCDAEVAAGAGEIVRIGGEWDVCCMECARELGDWPECRESCLFSLGPDEGGPDGVMDHEDYYRCQAVQNMLTRRGLTSRAGFLIGVELP